MTEAISQPIANIASLPTHEMARLEALRRYNILDTPPEKAFDRITSLAVRLFDVPTALISLVDESRAWFKSCFGFDRPEVSRDASICNFALLYDDVLVIPDTQQDERFVCNPFVQSDPGLRFYAGAPLLTEDGFNLGTLCLLDTQPHPTFTLEQKATLVDLAAIVMDELKLRLSTRIITQFDAALWEVTQGVSGVTGKKFFSALVQHLSTALGVNYACISLLINENPERVKTIAFYAKGEIIDNVEYELQGTPCLDVIRQQKMGCYVSNIQALFPDDHFLIALNIESYASIPFFDSRGKLLGLLGIMDNKSLENVSLVESLLPLFAMRIVAELERQQAEELQQEAAQRLQLYADVVRNTQVGIVVWQLEDPNDPGSFRLIIANPAASAATGFEFESIIGTTIGESFPKLIQTPLVQQYLEVVCTGRPQDLGEVVYGEDGISSGIYTLKAFPLPNHCLGLAFENITARKQIETQLHESQHYNQQITETLPGVLFVHDLIQQQNIYTNRQITDLLGYTSEQVQLMGTNAIATLVHPDDLERVLNYFDTFDTASDDAILGIEYRARHANHEYCWLYTQSVVFKRTPEGLPQQILGISIDISDRKRSEQALQTSEAWSKLAAQVAQLGAWRLYLETNLVEIDERMRQIWGEPEDAVMIPLPLVLERIHPDDRERVANDVNLALDPNGLGVYENKYRIVWNDGTERWVLAKGQVQFEGKGTARRAVDFFGTALDISDVYDQLRLRKQIEAVLTKQEQRYRYIFEAVSVAIWEEDFSEAQAAIQQLKAMGIQDFDQYFTEHPEFVQQMANSVRIQDVNQAALQMFGAKEKAQLLSSLAQIFVPETQAAFIGELLAIAHEETFFAAETVVQTLQGERLNVWFSITFPPASEPYNHVLVSLLDITQRKQSELEREQSEAVLNAFLTASPIALTLFDQNLRFIYANEALAQINGLPLSEHLGHTVWEVVPDMAPQFAPLLQQIIETQEPVLNLEYNGEVRPGLYRHTIANHFPVCLPNGEVLGVGVTVTDISDIKRVEAELRQSQERLSLALKATNQGLYDLNVQTGEAVVSPEYARMLGYEPEQFQETNGKWRERLHPDDVATVYRVYEEYLAGLRDDYRVEFRQRTQTGGWVWILSIGKIVSWDEAGNPVRMLGTHTDISDVYDQLRLRKQAEQALQQHSERLNLLYETTKDLLCAERPLDLMNRLFNRLCTLMDLHYYYQFRLVEKNGKSQLKLMNYSGISEEQAKLFETIEIGQAVCGLVAQQRCQLVLNKAEIAAHPHAEAICLMGVSAYSGQPLMVQGRLLGTLSFASLTRTEFTSEEVNLLQAISKQVAIALDRAELVASLQQQTEDLAQANRVKDEFLAVLSHELRSPLNPILGWTKLLQTGKFDSQRTKQALEVIERNAKQQTQLIDDLLDISKILRGKLILREAPVDLALTIEATLETMRLAAEAKSIQIKTEFDSFLPPVLGDGGRLQQIVLNLLSNAIKFTPNGGQVDVTLKRIKSEAQIKVKDNGKGITPDFLPYVFESFRQEDGKTTRKFGGLGLGLAIVRQLTELHGGTVQASSQGEGTGATFTVCLPLMKTTRLRVNSSSSNDGCFGEDHTLEGIKVLVVDDEADMRDLVVMVLEQAGAIAKTATSAAEALTIFPEFQPMLLMSDIGMPDMDGYLLMQKIRALPPEQGGFVPAIALSAYAGEYDQQQALKVGFQKHLPKPIEPEALVKAISELMNLTLP